MTGKRFLRRTAGRGPGPISAESCPWASGIAENRLQIFHQLIDNLLGSNVGITRTRELRGIDTAEMSGFGNADAAGKVKLHQSAVHFCSARCLVSRVAYGRGIGKDHFEATIPVTFRPVAEIRQGTHPLRPR